MGTGYYSAPAEVKENTNQKMYMDSYPCALIFLKTKKWGGGTSEVNCKSEVGVPRGLVIMITCSQHRKPEMDHFSTISGPMSFSTLVLCFLQLTPESVLQFIIKLSIFFGKMNGPN